MVQQQQNQPILQNQDNDYYAICQTAYGTLQTILDGLNQPCADDDTLPHVDLVRTRAVEWANVNLTMQDFTENEKALFGNGEPESILSLLEGRATPDNWPPLNLLVHVFANLPILHMGLYSWEVYSRVWVNVLMKFEKQINLDNALTQY